MQREQFHRTTQNNEGFYQPTVKKAQCFETTETPSNVGKNYDYERDKLTQAYGKIVSCFSLLTKHNTFEPYIKQKDVQTSNMYPAIDRLGYNLYVFDMDIIKISQHLNA